MKAYQTKVKKLPGSEYDELYPRAFNIYKKIKSSSKRRPYVRSKYFKKDKIFLDYFWEHLHQKNSKDRVRRLKYYSCALDVIRNSKHDPESKQNPNRTSEILHRFKATTDRDIFFVQIKEDKRSGQKFLLSIFPEEE